MTYVVSLVGAGCCDLLATVVADVTAVAATALTAMYTLNVTLHTGYVHESHKYLQLLSGSLR